MAEVYIFFFDKLTWYKLYRNEPLQSNIERKEEELLMEASKEIQPRYLYIVHVTHTLHSNTHNNTQRIWRSLNFFCFLFFSLN